jgi:hypothetical protein
MLVSFHSDSLTVGTNSSSELDSGRAKLWKALSKSAVTDAQVTFFLGVHRSTKIACRRTRREARIPTDDFSLSHSISSNRGFPRLNDITSRGFPVSERWKLLVHSILDNRSTLPSVQSKSRNTETLRKHKHAVSNCNVVCFDVFESSLLLLVCVGESAHSSDVECDLCRRLTIASRESSVLSNPS